MKLLSKWFTKNKVKNIEFCQNNLDSFLDQDSNLKFQQLLTSNKITFKEYKCLNQCNLCEQRPFLLIDGELIASNQMEDLLLQLQKKVM